jgi:oxygen-independent coproporphyrinogen-3 oxidase
MDASGGDSLGLYISIPFCRSKCTYCNFASGVYPASDHVRYVNRIIEDLRAAPSWASQMRASLPRQVDTVYLGGGTPSLLVPELIAQLFAAIRAEFILDSGAEITVECAPGQLTDETLQALTDAGVNRVSLGVQSFIDREAAVSGRLHNSAVVLNDVARLRVAGIANLSIDLIAGLAGQTFASWQESLAALAGSGVPHASVYMLEVDQDSRLGREVLAHGARYHADLVPTDDAIAEMYSNAIEALDRAGLDQYEISNFARPGLQSRHNLRYWQRRPYLGLGLDASSMLRESGLRESSNAVKPSRILRTTTTDDLQAYLVGADPIDTIWLSSAQHHEEAWFLGLRLNSGVEIAAIEKEFGRAIAVSALDAAARLVDAGLLVSDGKTLRLTPRGQLLSNDVFQEFLELEFISKTPQRMKREPADVTSQLANSPTPLSGG